MKFIFSVVYTFLIILNANAERSNYLDLNQFLKPDSDQYNDIGYLQIVPQYEENPDPKKAITIEYFFFFYDDSPESDARLKHIKEIISDDRRSDKNFKLEVVAISNEAETLKNSNELDHLLRSLDATKSKVHYDPLPEFINQETTVGENKKRFPSSFTPGRKFWTLIRFSSSMAGTFAGLYYMEGLSAHLAANVAFWPGMASGAITYYSNAYGAFLTNGKWSKWLMESETYFAKKMRSAFKLNVDTLEESIIKNKQFFREKYPAIYNKSPDLFEKTVSLQATENIANQKSRLQRIISKLHGFEEYFKWWVTEVAFTAVAIKMPQAILGVSQASSLLSMTGDVLMGATMGMLAQGPGDIAIQIRKYQKIAELRDAVKSGKMKAENSKSLLEEIEKVLAKTGPNANYSINKASHASLLKIENWSRSRATILSFFAVTGVGLEIAGVPLARPLLIGVGAWGAIYYSSVQGWIRPQKITDSVKKYIQKFKDGEVKLSMQFLKSRYCSAKFVAR